MKKSSAHKDYSSYVPYVLMLSVGIAIGVIAIKGTEFNAQAKVSELGGLMNVETSRITIPDNGKSGEKSMLQLTPATSFIILDCMDPDDCDFTLNDNSGETGDVVFVHYNPKTSNSNVPLRQMRIYNSKNPNTSDFSLIEGYTSNFIYNGQMWSYID